MGTIIHWNGGGWKSSDSLDELFHLLETEPLRPSLAPYVAQSPRFEYFTKFFGNFATVSHGFCVETDDMDLVARFVEALKRNPRG
jgi:hypothetical protein